MPRRRRTIRRSSNAGFDTIPATTTRSTPFTANAFARGDANRALFTAQALDAIGAANAEERAFAAKHRQEGLIRPTSPVTPEAWTRLLFHPEEEPLVGEIFSVVVSAVLMGRLSALRRDKALVKLPVEKKQDPAKTTLQAVRAFAWGAAILGNGRRRRSTRIRTTKGSSRSSPPSRRRRASG